MDTIDRPLVCVVCAAAGFPGDVCPCYSAAIAEDIRTTWSKIDDPEDDASWTDYRNGEGE